LRIVALDQAELPRTVPALDLFLTGDGCGDAVVGLHPHQPVDAIASGEDRTDSGPMLEGPPTDVVRHADIERSVAPTGENVDVERSGAPQLLDPLPLAALGRG
jgi:hypothetical protein